MATRRAIPFKPSTHGFHFANDFPRAPVLKIQIPWLGSVGIGNAAGGLCGGMVFAARDFFEAGKLRPDADRPPEPGSSLFAFLARRLLDSFDLPRGVLKYYEWMSFPDGDSSITRGLLSRTIHQEWPAIQTSIDHGHPCPLGLVTVHSWSPHRLAENHQVLAYAYELAGNCLRIYVYDPNHPDEDDVTLALFFGDSKPPTPITYSTGMSVRGFFRTRYRPANVSGKFCGS
jgi:hypothetical protein